MYRAPITIHQKPMSKGASDLCGYLTCCTRTLSMAKGRHAVGEYKVQKNLKQTVTNQLHRIVLHEKLTFTQLLKNCPSNRSIPDVVENMSWHLNYS
jgi:hypothetical protein